ncbi:unnamed protein product [Dovyalis caffra]|uniref:Nuclear pore complex protein n=1 Tax=Dovyalis caffra TaxID=77055 RepID=A0AAV1SS76_9ROSI|nr:unnamed protein product [Dovyalis caffra]
MEDVEMDVSNSYFDPEDLRIREQFRRYGKRHSISSVSPHQDGSISKFSESRLLYDGQNIHSPTNAALLLENIKQEFASIEADHFQGTTTPSRTQSAMKRRSTVDSRGGFVEADLGIDSIGRLGSQSLKACKIEDETLMDSGETTFGLFASLFDSSIQDILLEEERTWIDKYCVYCARIDVEYNGLMPIRDLILRFEKSCRDVSESIRYGSNIWHRAVEDKLMRQKAQFLLDEAATWSLLWYLYGKGNRRLSSNTSMLEIDACDDQSPSTSHLEACQFVVNDHTAQLCLRILQWLEGLASKALDLESKGVGFMCYKLVSVKLVVEVRGSHVGTYLPNSGIWHQTQRFLKRGASNTNTVHHLDFDAPTREHAHQLPDDKVHFADNIFHLNAKTFETGYEIEEILKQEESLLEDIWTLLRAGRLEKACDLCHSAGQPWRAPTLCPFGGLDLVPSVEALVKNGKNRMLQAIELESGIGHQWHLWKWASYCSSEKIAEQNGGKYEVAVYAAQCSNLKRMLPVCTNWESACWAMAKSWLDVQVDLELARSQPGRMDQLKSYGDVSDGSPGQIDSAAHAAGPENWPVQVLNQQPRNLSALLQKLHSGELVSEVVSRGCKEQHRQIEMDLMLGNIPHLLDMIWSWIAPSEDDQNIFRPHGHSQMIRFGAHLVLVLRYLLAEEMKDSFREKLMTQHEELVGIYASQLARHRCVDLFVHMMELRLNSR